MKKLLNFTVLFLIATSFYAQTPPSYYDDVNLNATGTVLFDELAIKIANPFVGIPYTSSSTDVWDACKIADEDPEIPENVLLIYGFDNTDGDPTSDRTRSKSLQQGSDGGTGLWNREHVFAKSLALPGFGTGEPGPGTDVHNLRPADSPRNSTRSNRKFSEGTGIASHVTSDGGWYPGDEWKGDVARIIMYMYVRYHGDGSKVSETSCLPSNIGVGTVNDIDSNMIDLFLKWNVEDPVNPFEINRNNELENIQKNRNPFIDNPYLATVIWGGLAAEDKWNMGGSSDKVAPTIPTNLLVSNETDESFDLNWSASTDNEGVYDYLIYLDGVLKQSSKTTSATILNLASETTYVVTIKARDLASNVSEASTTLNATTLVGPKILFTEDFENCANSKFSTYSEASSKNWGCESTFSYGENDSNSTFMNGYQETVASKDWLITTNPINFDTDTGEELSFYAGAAYGSSELKLLYSSDYSGSGDPSGSTWSSVPNITIPIKSDTTGAEEVFTFADVDISAITGTVYFAFKYYSNGVPTRWAIDNFEITGAINSDSDGDGVLNVDDLCANTPVGEVVNTNGCSNGQLDDDNDGVQNSKDLCSATPSGESVNSDGCSESQLDDDNDGIKNDKDECLNTPTGETVNDKGCWTGELDDDNDGVQNSKDLCSATPSGETVNSDGCSGSQLDDDNDGVKNDKDECLNTPTGETVNDKGCWTGELDDDVDGVQNSKDLCSATPSGESVNSDGCSESQLDDDNDGIKNDKDECLNTPTGETVNDKGCWSGEIDDDNDGVMNNKDSCPNTTAGAKIDASGCFTLASNNFNIETIGETCKGKNNGKIIITAIENYSYIATVNGTDYSFNNEKTIEGFKPGNYDVCIAVVNENYEQCYTVQINEGSTISGKSSVSSNKVEIDIEKGTAPFLVLVNGNKLFETNASVFSVDAKHGDLIEVKTAILCEGVYSKKIEMFDTVIAYPIPTKGVFEIALPVSQKEVKIELYSIQSQLISSKTYIINNGRVQLTLENNPKGMYIAKVYLDNPIIIKIVKN